MDGLEKNDSVGSMVARFPGLSRFFEEAKIDYCCGGRKPLEEACLERGIDAEAFLARLREYVRTSEEGEANEDLTELGLAALADHIEHKHHRFLREELPRLDKLTKKVAAVHGDRDARLKEIRSVFLALSAELSTHLMKEERILFPMVRQLDSSTHAPSFHCGTLMNPIRQMEIEHVDAGEALEKLRALSDDYQPPEWACNTYRAMLDALAGLERDLHEHIHKENNILFPRAVEMEKAKGGV